MSKYAEKITALTENDTMADEDLISLGNGGTASLRKITWANIIKSIKSKLGMGDTSLSGIGDGTVTGAISQLNTGKLNFSDILIKTVANPISVSNGYGDSAVSVALSGYKAIGIAGYSISNTYYHPYAASFDYSAQKATLGIRRISGTNTESVNTYVMIMYVKEH